jgi:hypothetical protein
MPIAHGSRQLCVLQTFSALSRSPQTKRQTTASKASLSPAGGWARSIAIAASHCPLERSCLIWA